ncbi:MAG: ComEC/Rec2 family competence protein [Pyrinomonadaceae bacterium]
MPDPPPKPEPLSLHPFLLLATSFGIGIAITATVSIPLKFSIPIFIVCGVISYRLFSADRREVVTASILIAFIVAGNVMATVESRVAAGQTVKQLYDSGTIPSGDPVEITGEMTRAPEPATDGFFISLRVEEVRYRSMTYPVNGDVWLFAPVRDRGTLDYYSQLEPRYGARMRVLVALKRVDNFRNPGVTLYTEFLDHRGQDATGTIKHPGLIDRLDDGRVFLPLAWLYEMRQRLLAVVVDRFDPETAGVLAASMLGNRYYLSADTSERFRSGGTFHILIISGMHLTVIGIVVLWIVRRSTKSRWLQYLVPVAVVWGYAAAVGGESTIVRAALMFTAAGASFVLFRRSSSLNALGASALLLLLVRPSELFSPSFQLTFVAVLAIVGLAIPVLTRMKAIGSWHPAVATPNPPVTPRWLLTLSEALFWSERAWRVEQARSAWHCRLFKSPIALFLERWRIQRPLRWVFEGLFVSVCAQLALLPLLVIYFHRLAAVSLLLNLFVGILMALLTVVAFVSLIVSLLSAHLATPFVFLTNKSNWLLTHVGDLFLRSSWASWRLPEYSGPKGLIYLAYLGVLVIVGYLIFKWDPFKLPAVEPKTLVDHRRISHFAGLTTALLAIVIIGHPFSAPRPDGRLRLDYLDVGQGDSILVTMPDGRRILIDGGGQAQYGAPTALSDADPGTSFRRDERNIGESVVSEYLWYRGIDTVDLVIATHPDTDHIDGLNAVVRNFHVGAALVGTEFRQDEDYIRFLDTLAGRRVPHYFVRRNEVLQFGNATLEFLWPSGNVSGPDATTNNESVVTRVCLGKKCFLLTGDIESPTEQMLAAVPKTIACDVLKVAHHGSRTSTSEPFLTAAHPKVAVISVGLTSIFGHPHHEVVERLRDSGARVLTTGRSGTITISTDGNDLQVEEFVKSGD